MSPPSLDVFLMRLTKEAIRDAAQCVGGHIPLSWKKERMTRRLAELYEENPSALLPFLGLPTVLFLAALAEKRPDGRIVLKEHINDILSLPNILRDLRLHGLILFDDGLRESIVAPFALRLAQSAS